MRIISWNVNGLRSILEGPFREFLEQDCPDILCLQETKTGKGRVNSVWPPEYLAVFESARSRLGYSGTAILTRIQPQSVWTGIGVTAHDSEGRVITMEWPDWFLVNVYVPNSGRELERLSYRAEEWDAALRKHLKALDKEKPVVVCGDFNVAVEEIDLARPKQNRGNNGFTDEERTGFRQLKSAGFLDTFREINGEKEGQYSWWSYRSGAREKNIGWRLDYVLISERLRLQLKDAFILPEIHGADHCPVGVEMVL